MILETINEFLPKEIIDKILEYQGFHCWRNEKYMCQIPRYDPRREMILTRNKKYFPRVEKNKFQSSVYISREMPNYSSYSIIIQILIISLGFNNTIVLWIMNTDKIQWNKKVVQTRVQHMID